MSILNAISLSLLGGLGGDSSTSTNWTISGFLSALQKSALNYVKIIILIVGVVMVGVGIYQVAKNLISHGKGQTNWVITALLIVVGGTLMLGTGWDVIKNIANGSKQTLDDMGKGTADDGHSVTSDGGAALTIMFE